MKGIKKVKIGEVCSIRRGASPRPINNFLIDTPGIPWLKISDASSDDCVKIIETKQFITNEGKDKSVYLEKGSLVLSNSGTPCIPKIIDLDLCIHDGWLTFSDFNGIDKAYLYYIFKYHRKHILAQGNGSIFKNLKTDILKEYEIYLPDLLTQKKIADLLSSLDDKIEINNKINAELEELGQALYTKWFVNYDFPNEEGKPYKSSGGEMIESELGMIPKGWKVDNILSIFNFEKGVEPGSNNYTNNKDDIRFIRVKDMETTSPDVYVSEDTMGTKKLKYISSKDIVISLDGTIGKVFVGNEGCISSGIGIIKLKDYEYMIDYTYLFAKSNYLINSLTGGSSGSVIKHAGGRLNDLKIVHPNTDTLLKFQNSYNGIVEMIIQNRIENKKLEELRDFLIPQLMSGNLEIKDIEGKLKQQLPCNINKNEMV